MGDNAAREMAMEWAAERSSFEIRQGDALEVLRTMPENHFDGCLSDPPYGLSSSGGGKRISDRIFDALIQVGFPDLMDVIPQSAETFNLTSIPFSGSSLRGEDRPIGEGARVGMPEGAIDLQDGSITDQKIDQSAKAARLGIPDRCLPGESQPYPSEFLGDFILDLGDVPARRARNEFGGCYAEAFAGGFAVPIMPEPDTGCPCLFSGGGPVIGNCGPVGLENDALSGSQGPTHIVATPRTVNTFMLRFNVAGTPLELLATYRADERGEFAEFRRPRLVRATTRAGSLPSKAKSIRVRLVTPSADGTYSVHWFHLWIPSQPLKSIIPPGGFMGKGWDSTLPDPEVWREVYRVLKPGAMLMAFGGTRTHHRLMCAIEDAGFEVRDCLMWLYGSGFPKSLDIGKALDKAAGMENVVGTKPDRWTGKGSSLNFSTDRPQSECKVTAPATDAAKTWDGWGTALKPAFEPILYCRKPLTLVPLFEIIRMVNHNLGATLCLLLSSVSDAEGVLRLSPVGPSGACVSVATLVALLHGAKSGDLSGAMGTFNSPETVSTCLSIATLWSSALGALLSGGSRFTTLMETEAITILRTLNCLLSENIPADIMEDVCPVAGSPCSALGVEGHIASESIKPIHTSTTFVAALASIRAFATGTDAAGAISGLRAIIPSASSVLRLVLTGTATPSDENLRPNWEPIILAMKPCDGTFAENALKWGVAGLNVDGGRIRCDPRPVMVRTATIVAPNAMSGASTGATLNGQMTDLGRWPANLLLGCACDGEHEPGCAVRMLDGQSGNLGNSTGGGMRRDGKGPVYAEQCGHTKVKTVGFGDSGGASRYFKTIGVDCQDSLTYNEACPETRRGAISENRMVAGIESGETLEAARYTPRSNPSGCGSKPMDQSPVGLRSTTKIETKHTTNCLTSNLSARRITMPYTQRIDPTTDLLEPLSRDDARSAEGTNVCSSSSAVQPGPSKDTAPSASGGTLPHGESSTGNASTPTCGSTEPTASRFRYTAKASRSERGGSTHPTMKPLKLCEYLARLLLPPARPTPRRLLVPFSGSGSEMIGARHAGWESAVGIDSNAEYCEIARRRIAGDAPLFTAVLPLEPAAPEPEQMTMETAQMETAP